MRSIVAITILTGLAVPVAVASNVINEHSGYYQESVHYTILTSGGNDYAVLINEGSVSTQLWKFEAYDSATGDPGYIDYIRIDPTDDVGPIKLSIVGASGHTYGAEDVGQINLTDNADDTTEIVDIAISGDLATDDDVSCNSITGTIDIGGNLASNKIYVTGDIDGTITIKDCCSVISKQRRCRTSPCPATVRTPETSRWGAASKQSSPSAMKPSTTRPSCRATSRSRPQLYSAP